jgi:hypothetical protein
MLPHDEPRDATRVSTSRGIRTLALTVPDVPRARAAAPRSVQTSELHGPLIVSRRIYHPMYALSG